MFHILNKFCILKIESLHNSDFLKITKVYYMILKSSLQLTINLKKGATTAQTGKQMLSPNHHKEERQIHILQTAVLAENVTEPCAHHSSSTRSYLAYRYVKIRRINLNSLSSEPFYTILFLMKQVREQHQIR